MTPTTAVRRNAYRTMAVMADLTRRGCRVLEAHAHAVPPVIRISPPPAGLFETYGYQSPPPGAVRIPVTCVAERWHTRIEWISKEPNQ